MRLTGNSGERGPAADSWVMEYVMFCRKCWRDGVSQFHDCQTARIFLRECDTAVLDDYHRGFDEGVAVACELPRVVQETREEMIRQHARAERFKGLLWAGFFAALVVFGYEIWR